METISGLEIEKNKLEELIKEWSNSENFHVKPLKRLKDELDRVEEKLLIAKNAINPQKSEMRMASL